MPTEKDPLFFKYKDAAPTEVETVREAQTGDVVPIEHGGTGADTAALARTNLALSPANIKTYYESNADTNEFSDALLSKLNAIEAGATADLTAGEIKTLYESNLDTNEFSDAEQTKLAGIEAAADVTDATNVNAAGATMNTDTDVKTNSWVVDEDDFFSNLDTKVPTQQSVKKYVDDAIAGVSQEATTAQSLGGDANVFKSEVGNDLQFRGISAGTGILVAENATDIPISIAAGGVGTTQLANGAVDNTKLANNAVTNAKAADMAQDTIKGRVSVGSGNPEDMNPATVRGMLNVADGANNYVHPNHTGDVTSLADGATTIVAGAVSNAQMEDMAANHLKMRDTGTGPPQDLKISELTEEASPSALDWILGEDAAGNLRKYDVGNLPTGGGGEANLGANVGTGVGKPFRDKTGVTLNMKSIAAGTAIDVTNGADDVTVGVTAGSIGATQLTDEAFTAADHSKLDGIEAGATADQTAGEILTSIKTVDGSGSGLDADLLDGYDGESLAVAASTGLLTGGVLSVGTPNTTFSITDGTGEVVDNSVDPVTITAVSWSGETNLSVTNLATHIISFISIDSAGNVVQRTSHPTNAQRRSEIFLGVVVHVNNTIVNAVNNEQSYAVQPLQQLHDLASAIGFFNVSGNVLGTSGADMTFDKSVGEIHFTGANYATDPLSPNVKTMAAKTDIAFQYRLQDGTNRNGSPTAETVIDPDIWDDGTPATFASVATNKWTVQRVYQFLSEDIKILPGQAEYSSQAKALQGVTDEQFVTEPSMAANGLLRGFIIVKQGETDLTSSDTLFIEAERFGTTSGSGGTSVTDLGTAYTNSPDPEITLDATRGALSVRDASSPIGANLLEIQNNAQTTDFFAVDSSGVSVDGNVAVTGTVDGRDVAADGTKLDGIETAATADQTAADIRGLGFFDTTNDGTGSGLDADLLDGNEAAAFATSAQGATADSALQDVVDDTTPQLGGQLDVNGNAIGDGTLELLTFSETVSAVNHVEVKNAATGAGPTLTGTGDDANVDLHLATKGTGNVKVDDDLDVTGNITVTGTVDGIDIATDVAANTAKVTNATHTGDVTGATALTIANGVVTNAKMANMTAGRLKMRNTGNGSPEDLKISELTADASPGSGDFFLMETAAGALRKVDTDNMPGGGGGLNNVVEDLTPQLGGQLDVNGNAIGDGTLELLTFSETVSAVNHVEVKNAATGAGPTLTGTGDDANVDLHLATKGTGNVKVDDDLDVTGNITVTGTVDGIDIATDVAANTAKVSNANHTGDVTGDTALTIANNAVTNAKAADMNADLIKGRANGAGPGDPQDLTAAQVRTIINVEDNADVTDATNVAAAGAVMADGSGNDITGDVVFTEKADHSSTPAAGKGYLWTKNTAPSTLIFTDDTGVDTTLGSGGGGLNNVVEDLTPQLGGDLDVNGKEIQSSANVIFQLGDNAGVNKLAIQDSLGTEVAAVDSDGSWTLRGSITVDVINEDTPAAGVTIDSVVLKDGLVDGVDVTTLMADLVDDTTPELGGEMDCGLHTIGFTQQSAGTTIDWKLSNKAAHTLTADTTFVFTAPSNPCNILLKITQDSIPRTITWPSVTVKWPNGVAPTISTGSGAVDIFTFYFDGTSYYGMYGLDFS